jgi:hypothetical protein
VGANSTDKHLSSLGVATVRLAEPGPAVQEAAPEGMCVNLLRFKRKNGLSNHLKEAAASENVIASAPSQESVQLCE